MQNRIEKLSFPYLLRTVSCILLLTTLVHCTEERQTYQIFVKASTPSRAPVEGLSVLVNGELLGYSNKNGEFLVDYSYPAESEIEISLRKSSDNFYYSPITTRLKTTMDKKRLILETIVYVLEKSTPIKEPAPKAIEVTESNLPPEPLEDVGASDLSLLHPTVEPTGLELSMLEVNKIGPEPLVLEPEPPIDEHVAMDEPKEWLTLYVRNNLGKGIEGAVVTLHHAEGPAQAASSEVSLGSTRSDGRLFFEVSAESRQRGTLSIAKEGYERQELILAGLSSSEKTTEVRLKRGLSLEVETLVFDGTYRPLKAAELYVNNKIYGKTNDSGRITGSIGVKRGELATVKIVTSDSELEPFETNFVVDETITIKKVFTKMSTPSLGQFFLSTEQDIFDSGKLKEWLDNVKLKLEKNKITFLPNQDLDTTDETPSLLLGKKGDQITVEILAKDEETWTASYALTHRIEDVVKDISRHATGATKIIEYSKGIAKLAARPDQLSTVRIGDSAIIKGHQRDETGNQLQYGIVARGEVSALSRSGIEVNIHQVYPRSMIAKSDLVFIRPAKESADAKKSQVANKP